MFTSPIIKKLGTRTGVERYVVKFKDGLPFEFMLEKSLEGNEHKALFCRELAKCLLRMAEYFEGK